MLSPGLGPEQKKLGSVSSESDRCAFTVQQVYELGALSLSYSQGQEVKGSR